jgi:hypothetical protein
VDTADAWTQAKSFWSRSALFNTFIYTDLVLLQLEFCGYIGHFRGEAQSWLVRATAFYHVRDAGLVLLYKAIDIQDMQQWTMLVDPDSDPVGAEIICILEFRSRCIIQLWTLTWIGIRSKYMFHLKITYLQRRVGIHGVRFKWSLLWERIVRTWSHNTDVGTPSGRHAYGPQDHERGDWILPYGLKEPPTRGGLREAQQVPWISRQRRGDWK